MSALAPRTLLPQGLLTEETRRNVGPAAHGRSSQQLRDCPSAGSARPGGWPRFRVGGDPPAGRLGSRPPELARLLRAPPRQRSRLAVAGNPWHPRDQPDRLRPHAVRAARVRGDARPDLLRQALRAAISVRGQGRDVPRRVPGRQATVQPRDRDQCRSAPKYTSDVGATSDPRTLCRRGRPPTSWPPSSADWSVSAPRGPIANGADPETEFISDRAC